MAETETQIDGPTDFVKDLLKNTAIINVLKLKCNRTRGTLRAITTFPKCVIGVKPNENHFVKI